MIERNEEEHKRYHNEHEIESAYDTSQHSSRLRVGTEKKSIVKTKKIITR